LLGGLLIYVFFVAFRGLGRSADILEKQQEEKQFQQRMEDLLTKGLGKDAFFAATERLANRPRDPYVYWYLGQANYQMQKYLEAKRSFSTVREIDPTWQSAVEPWLERVEEEIRNSGPKVVK
jgi:tetratricopeptide (TPR) repeat protein